LSCFDRRHPNTSPGYHTSRRGEIEIEAPERDVKIKLDDPPALRTLGDLVHFDHVEFRHPRATKPLLSDITFTVEQGGRLALVGANGQGKSTLAKLIMGELQPTRGSIVRHPLLKIGYFSQHSVEDLSTAGNVTALAYFLEHFAAKGVQVEEQAVRACLGSFGLGGRLASDVPLSQLSGGQKVGCPLPSLTYSSRSPYPSHARAGPPRVCSDRVPPASSTPSRRSDDAC
jgi:ATP-binding cassette subfamily F protein 3